jgi:hypothetical protein
MEFDVPFKYFVFDNFLKESEAEELSNEFAPFDSKEWFSYENPLEIKKTIHNWYSFPSLTYKFLSHLNSEIFIDGIKDLTGTQDLYCDQGLHGGGLNPYEGYMSVDLRDTADVVADLNDGIPLADNSVGVLNASHILEHLHDKHKIMSEIHRVLAPGGWAFIEVPSTDGRGAFQDPTHVSYWNENCFLYYTDSYLGNFIDNTDIRFQQYRRETWFPNEWMKNLNVCVTTAWLVAIKDDVSRLPGPLNI